MPRGFGVYGNFIATQVISRYTRARLFERVGNQYKTFDRFSTVTGKVGYADTVPQSSQLFAEVEQAAFEPGDFPPGLRPSPEKMLQVRLERIYQR